MKSNNKKIKKQNIIKYNIVLNIMYDGSKYAGWQRLSGQDSLISVQGLLEDKLKDIIGEDIRLIGSGRTDAGVHAYAQIANFHTSKKIIEKDLLQSLNQSLPHDIRITNVHYKSKKFHSRYDVVSKTYEYRIDTREVPSVFKRKYYYHHPGRLDLHKMREGAEYLIGTHDFRSFSSTMRDSRSTVKTIFEVNIIEEKDSVVISIKGNGFLYNMVRIIVGTLIEVGEGKKRPAEIRDILLALDRQLAGPTMTSHALFLKNVEYKL